MEERIMEQKRVIAEVEEEIKANNEDIKAYKKDLAVYTKITSIIKGIPEEHETSINDLLATIVNSTNEVIKANEEYKEKLNKSLSDEKAKLRKLEKIKKEYEELTVNPIPAKQEGEVKGEGIPIQQDEVTNVMPVK